MDRWLRAGSLIVAAVAGCARGGDAPAPSRAAAPAVSVAIAGTAAPAPAAASPVMLGERITAPVVALSDVAKDPARYSAQAFATTGKVTAVCQEMGCWMQLEDASGRAHIRMHGHAFFVPKSAPGHLARVQATLVRRPGGADDCEEGKAASAQLELDATGVEID